MGSLKTAGNNDSTEATGAAKVILVRAGNTWCSLPLGRVRRVLHAPKLFPLPGADERVAGLAEVDGEPFVVLSLEHLLGAEEGAAPELPVAFLVEIGDHGGEVVTLLADEAGEIARLAPDAIAGPADGIALGTAELAGRLVQVLDLGAFGEMS